MRYVPLKAFPKVLVYAIIIIIIERVFVYLGMYIILLHMYFVKPTLHIKVKL